MIKKTPSKPGGARWSPRVDEGNRGVRWRLGLAARFPPSRVGSSELKASAWTAPRSVISRRRLGTSITAPALPWKNSCWASVNHFGTRVIWGSLARRPSVVN